MLPRSPRNRCYPNYLRVNGGSFNPYGNAFTISLWIKPVSVSRQQFLFASQSGDDWLLLRAGGYLGSYNMGAGDLYMDGSYHSPIKANEWTHIVVTYAGNGTTGPVTYYINGSQIHSHSGRPSGQNPTFYSLGGKSNSTTNTGCFTGQTDEMSFYQGALNAADIQALYEEGADQFKEIELSISGTYDFGSAMEDYDAPAGKTIIVSNTGNQPTGDLSIALSGDNADCFTLSKTSIDSIAADNKALFTVTPDVGLAAGNYSATVTVSGTDLVLKTFTVCFNVQSGGTHPKVTSFVTRPDTIVTDLAAWLPVDIAGNNLEGADMKVYLVSEDERISVELGAAVDGNNRFYLEAAPEPGNYNIVLKINGANTALSAIKIVPYNTNIWTVSTEVVEGKLLLKFNADMILKNETGCVTIGNGQYNAKVYEDERTIEILELDASALASGTVFSVKGVKYPVLFPSYSFTFQITMP